jgi:hypothetical protein
MNGQSNKTIDLFVNEILHKKSIELDATVATCLLSACRDCHRLDIGEYVHREIIRLKLLEISNGQVNVRLATAVCILTRY